MANPLPPMPRDPIGENHKWREWFNIVRNSIVGVAGSVPTLHNSLTDIQGGTSTERYHLTQAQQVDLTDAGDSTLHYHSTDRDSDNFTGTEWSALTTPAYGEMYATNITETVTVSATNTAYEITGGFTVGSLLRTTFGSDHYIAVDNAGTYKVTWSLTIDTTGGGDQVEGGVMINGTAQSNATSHSSISAVSAGECIAATGILTLAANDQVSLFVRNHTGVRDIHMQHASFVIEKLLT